MLRVGLYQILNIKPLKLQITQFTLVCFTLQSLALCEVRYLGRSTVNSQVLSSVKSYDMIYYAYQFVTVQLFVPAPDIVDESVSKFGKGLNVIVCRVCVGYV